MGLERYPVTVVRGRDRRQGLLGQARVRRPALAQGGSVSVTFAGDLSDAAFWTNSYAWNFKPRPKITVCDTFIFSLVLFTG